MSKKRTRKQEAVYTLLFMLVITVVCVSGVSLAYQLTKKQIKLNQNLLQKKAVLFAGGITPKGNAEAIAEQFKQQVTEIKDDKGRLTCYRIKGKGIVVPQSGIGLWGTIRSVIGFDSTGKEMTGIFFTENNETPGLGAKIGDLEFRNQFPGKKDPIKLMPPGQASTDHEFDAITGATITSTAVEKMINSAFKKVPELIDSKDP